jgi:FkbM family methyltransferase
VELLTFQARARAVEDLSQSMLATVETNEGPIRFFCPSPLLAMRAKTLLTKEPDTIRWIDSFAVPCVFWDVGANVGVYSLYAASKPAVSVLSFEPLAANFHVLSRNIQLNDFGERVSAYCVALSGITELGVLNIASPAMGSALTQFGQLGEMSPYCAKDLEGSAHGMIGYSMDDFISQFHPPFPNYLKMDVDGLELVILLGAKRTLRDSRLRSLMVELSMSHGDQRQQACALLQDCGFSLMSVGEVQATDAGEGANHLFTRGSA